MTRSFDDYSDDEKPKCPHCGGTLPCSACKRQVEKPGVKVSGSEITVTLPVGQDKSNADSLLRTRGIDPESVEVVSVVVNQWEALRQVYNGTGQRTTEPIVLHQTKVTYRPIPHPAETPWGRFLIGLDNLTPTRPPRRKLKPITDRSILWFVHGDDQAPYTLGPLHDLTLAFLADISPDRGLHLGDLIDFGEISGHRQKRETAFDDTTLEGIDAGHQVAAERTEAAGLCEWSFLYGNHEKRILKYLIDRAPAFVGIRKAITPDHLDPAKLLDVPNLLRFDELGWTAIHDERGDYPYSTIQIADELLAAHGWLASKGAGASALKSIDRLNSGLIVGHTHRLGIVHVTRWEADGEPKVYTGAEAGTMADPRGLGYTRDPDWQNGFLTVETRDGGHSVDIAVYRDRVLRWRDREWRLTAKGVRTA